MRISEYLRISSHRFYGAVTALFMITLYEIFVMAGAPTGLMIRNGPEAWVRNILNFFGISHYHISFLMLGAAIIAVPLLYDHRVVYKNRVIPYMLAESLFWGAISGLLIQLVIGQLFFMTGYVTGSLIGDLGLAIGAGLFEELMFRVVLTTLLIKIGLKLFRVRWLSVLLAILIASFLFSYAHYIGNSADAFEVYSFLFRFFAGIWFTTLYAVRGFAIVCLTHALYDILIIVL